MQDCICHSTFYLATLPSEKTKKESRDLEHITRFDDVILTCPKGQYSTFRDTDINTHFALRYIAPVIDDDFVLQAAQMAV